MNKKYEIYPTSIWKFKVSNYKTLNKNIISEVYKLKENDNDGLTKSNRGGWHSYQSSKLFPKLSKIISLYYITTFFYIFQQFYFRI